MNDGQSKEVFINMPSFPEYEVSNTGKVYSRITDKVLSPNDNGNGYLKLALRKEGKTYLDKQFILFFAKHWRSTNAIKN